MQLRLNNTGACDYATTHSYIPISAAIALRKARAKPSPTIIDDILSDLSPRNRFLKLDTCSSKSRDEMQQSGEEWTAYDVVGEARDVVVFGHDAVLVSVEDDRVAQFALAQLLQKSTKFCHDA